MSPENTPPPSRRRMVIAQIVAYLAAWAIVLPVEICRFDGGFKGADILEWPNSRYWSAPLFVPLLVLAPLAWWCRRWFATRRQTGTKTPLWTSDDGDSVGHGGARAWGFALLCAAIAIGVSASIGRRFDDLPPAYHDEYSYLFQAKTFLAGRASFPSHEAPRLFDQMHVLNEGRFASRYFPGAGLWMTPFVAAGHPYWGHWLAGGIAAFFLFWTGRDLGGDGVGLVAGLITAVSPGMALFSNLLLAHHPTLVGLSLFVFTFLRWRTRKRIGYALCAGVGLTFAMYCRPMTAAGVGLPFGIAFAHWLLTAGRGAEPVAWGERLKHAAALAGPIVIGLAAMFAYNRAITGNGMVAPYQLYTEIYTPRHVYGFNNVVRGERHLGPRVIDNYDRWAENLTGPLAAKNVAKRLAASLRWTLGIVPLVMAGIVFVIAVNRRNGNAWLIFWAIVSLHVAHIPYWFSGIMDWHYVFESGPLWGLVFAVATGRLMLFWRNDERPWMPVWWAAFALSSLWMTYCSFEPFWTARIDAEIVNIRFSREKLGAFRRLIEQHAQPRPTIVFVEHDPADVHINYVINDPPLDADILVAHYLPETYDIAALKTLFPGRSLYLFRAETGEFAPLTD